MKILHTSDWHLGHNLMFMDRKNEHQQFLDWLLNQLYKKTINLLVVSGDIFDTGTPPNYALSLYYQFLVKASSLKCLTDIVIIGGNHDSVSTLNAPKEILSYLNVHVVGGITENLENEVIEIKNKTGKLKAVVCAVPFLSDRDLRKAVPGESYEEKCQKLQLGMKNHYESVLKLALNRRDQQNTPIIATGHLFTAGGEASEGERDIYVGSLGYFPAEWFPKEFSYIALGHLHKAQKVSKNDHIRFSGSPLPLSFGELNKEKIVLIYDTESKTVSELRIPLFQPMQKLKGSFSELEEQLLKLFKEEREIWLELTITDEKAGYSESEKLKELCKDSLLKIFKIVKEKVKATQKLETEKQSLAELTTQEVFSKKLQDSDKTYTNEQLLELHAMFSEAYNECLEEDK